MAAAKFSRDVLEMFYGPIEEKQRLPTPISSRIRGEFEIVRNNFKDWPELGRSTKKDMSRARVAHGLGHASDDRAGNEGRNINGEQTVREGEQPVGRRIRPIPTH